MAFDLLRGDDEDAVLSTREVEAIRRGDSSMADVEAAEKLVDSVAGLMISVATDGPPIKTVDAGYQREHRALSAVLRRLGIEYPNGFDDLWRWYGRWSDGTMPRYRDRRVFIADLFSPVRKGLASQVDSAHELTEGVAEEAADWPAVDQQSARLRRLWREADDADAYNAVGLQSMKMLTTLGHVIFDSHRDLPAGEEEPGRDDAKRRIGFFLRRVASGDRGENIRKVVNGAYGQANAAKHRHLATRADAGIAANAALLVISTLRLLADEDEGRMALDRDNDIPF